MSEKLIYVKDVLKYTVLAGEIRHQYMEVVPAYYMREAPAVDAVEVVRCSRCKYWEPTNNSWMDRNRTDGVCRTLMEFRLAERYMTEKDHFCGFGERREDDEVD